MRGRRIAGLLPKLLLAASMGSFCRRLPRPPPRDAAGDHLPELLLPTTYSTGCTHTTCCHLVRPLSSSSIYRCNKKRFFVPVEFVSSGECMRLIIHKITQLVRVARLGHRSEETNLPVAPVSFGRWQFVFLVFRLLLACT
jgi:hypothetical protein